MKITQIETTEEQLEGQVGETHMAKRISQNARPISSKTMYPIATSLPSKCIFYSEAKESTDLQVTPLTVADAFQFQAATETDTVRPIINVISSHLFDAEENHLDSNFITYGDFAFLMFWHRSNGYFKNPITLNWWCNDEGHIKKITEEKAKVETLENESLIRKTDLEVNYLDVDAVKEQYQKVYEDYGVELTPQLVKSYAEYMSLVVTVAETVKKDIDEVPKRKDGTVDVDKLSLDVDGSLRGELYLKQIACYLSDTHGETLQEKADFLVQLDVSPDLLFEIKKFIDLADHGVSEQVQVTCKECGAVKEERLSFDARHFFPEI